jgi:CheY-like chemotaxis protein
MDKSKSILLLEDDTVDVMTIKRALKQLNVDNPLKLAGNGEEGLRYLNQTTELPGLIILDINMPKMNGLEFLEQIKKNEKWRVIPVVILTTSLDQNDKWTSFQLGITGYMVKPVDYNRFKDMMATVINYWGFSESAY